MSRKPELDPEPVAIDVANQIGVLSEEKCIELIESTPIGRVGFQSDGTPLVLPVNFKWTDAGVVFRSLEGQKMAAAADNQPVCFEVDYWDGDKRAGWSVVLRGTARRVTDWAEVEQLEQVGLVPWAKETWRPFWVRIEPTEISGRVLA
jgi:nitroimidazol reductase NimA-like FMN-containing flavoprotein (pyridoxamine 5'-phosphate oxidase superfamily)